MKKHNYTRRLISLFLAVFLTAICGTATSAYTFGGIAYNASQVGEQTVTPADLLNVSLGHFLPGFNVTQAQHSGAIEKIAGVRPTSARGHDLTREQAAMLASEALEMLGYPVGTVATTGVYYSDGASISPAAQSAVASLTRKGIVGRDEKGRFKPKSTLTRADGMKLLNSFGAFIKREQAYDRQVYETISQMSLEQKIGQVLFVNFRKWQTQDMEEPQGMETLLPEVEDVIKRYHLGNIVLFGENVKSNELTLRLTRDLQRAASENGDQPLLIGIDQEGGGVTRLGQGTCLPGNMALGAAGNPEYAFEAGKLMGEELSALGINCDLAPVADVNDNPQNPVIGLRSFGSDPKAVSELSLSLSEGLASVGVISCAKHFPGHGNTSVDTHTGLALVDKTRAQWNKTEALPFQTLITSGIDMVMSAHIQYPQLDGTMYISMADGEPVYIPATLSPGILTGILRDELGFDGVISTDAMDMKAITDNFGETEAVVMALQAGADLLCNPTTLSCPEDVAKLDAIYAAVADAVNDGRLPIEQLDASVSRVLKLKAKRGILDEVLTSAPTDGEVAKALAVVGSPAHRAIEREIAQAAITLPGGDYRPFELSDGETLLIVAPYANELPSAAFAINRLIEEKKAPHVALDTYCYNGLTELAPELEQKMTLADHIIVFSEIAGAALSDDSHWLSAMPHTILAFATNAGKADKTAVISIGLPNDAQRYPAFPVYLAYGNLGMSEDDAASGVVTGKYGPNIVAGVECALGGFAPKG